ncbi:MAG: isochorismatase family protein [Chloroflexi bacterium]|nr:isochorismatase family protein [Chloroflexota bacterium]
MHPWEDLLTETDRQVLAKSGFGKQRGLGQRPALLLIDCQYNHIGADKPIVEQLAEYPSGGGSAAWSAARRLVKVREAARAAGAPVIYTRFCYTDRGAKYDGFALKRGNVDRFIDGRPGTRIIEELTPREDELVLDKTTASVFFSSPLVTYLTRMGIDSLIIGGVSTSGCVRASTIDAVSYGFNAAVLEDGTADRIDASHKIALLDLWMKYSDVMTCDAAISYLNGIAADRQEKAAVGV